MIHKTDYDLRIILRAKTKEIGSIRKWAEKNGVSKSLVSRALNKDTVFPSSIGKILGYKKTRFWIKG